MILSCWHNLSPLSASLPPRTKDSEIEGDSLTVSPANGPSHGSLMFVNSDGSFTYTPDTNYTGSDSFTYTVNDGILSSNPATVTINVTDNAPVANDDSYSVLHDQELDVDASTGVLANDTDADGDSLTASLASGTSHGTVQLAGDGSFMYVPTAGYVGSDSFTYTASDGILTSSPATVTLDVTDNAPTAGNLSYDLPENSTENVPAANGLLSAASDADGDPLTVSSWTQPSDGTLNVSSDGSFIYTPNTNYVGSDSFQYTVSDGALTATATVTLTIHNPDTAPVAVDDSYSVVHDQELDVDASSGVLANDSDADGDPLTAVLVSDPSDGTLNLNSDGSFTYMPNAGWIGTDSFTYKAYDGQLYSNVATVTISVTDRAPVAVNDSYDVESNNEFDADYYDGVLANDTDADGDSLTATLVNGPSNGTLNFNSDGTFAYVPNQNFTGTDTFTYTANDSVLTSNTATVTLTVTASPPVAEDDSYDVEQNNTLNMPANGVLANDYDPDDLPITAVNATQPSHGSVTLNSDGSFSYTPDSDYVGSDSFTYEASDGTLTSDPATVTITVTSTDTAPVAGNLSYSVDENTSLSTDSDSGVLSAASDADNDPLTAVLVSNPSDGTLDFNSDGSFTYTPNTNYYGSDSFQFKVFDGTLYSNVATATLTVNEDVPTAVDDNYSVLASGATSVTADNGVLANDSDPDGTALTAVLESQPSYGSVTFNSDGSFSYTPNDNFTGTDSFTYEAYNGMNYSTPATVTLTSGPVASDETYNVPHDQTLTVDRWDGLLSGASDADGDTLTPTLSSGPSDGSVTVNSNGSFTYTPNTHFVGTDSFTYTVSDGTNTSQPATVTIDVTNDVPTLVNGFYSTPENTALTVSAANGVLTYATDDDEGSLTVQLVNGPSDGSLMLGSDGSFTYTPNAGFFGTDSFTYDVSNGLSTSAPATVTLSVDELLSQSNNDFRAVATGDFNNDGNADFVAANYSTDSVSVFMGNGDGTFQTPTVYNVGNGPLAVAVGNFGNGYQDIAVANSLDNTVTILMNNGSGMFTSSQVISVGTDPVSLAAGDFVGDGVLDLAVANEGSNTVSILQNNGSGTFTLFDTISVGTAPDSVAAGDLNGDGDDDLVVANSGDNNISVLLSNGDDTFVAPVNYAVGSGPTSVVVADLNGDGKADVAVANGGSNNVSVLLGNGDGTLIAAVNYTVGSDPVGIAVGDFDGDGVPDLAVVNHGSNDETVLYNSGCGVFLNAQTNPLGESPDAVAVADFNKDGLMDQVFDGKPGVVMGAINQAINLPPVIFSVGHNIALITDRTVDGDYVKGISDSNTVRNITGPRMLIWELGKFAKGYFHAIVISGHGSGLGVQSSAGGIGNATLTPAEWRFVGSKLGKDGVLVFESCSAAGGAPYTAMKDLAKLIGHPVIASEGSTFAGGGSNGYWVKAFPDGTIVRSKTE